MLKFDDEASRRVETTYLTPDVVAQRRAVIRALGLRDGEDVIDIGSGPGLLACDMAAVVGARGSVVGIEPSESMRGLAARREPDDGSAPISYRDGEAGALPAADESFDAAVSTQVYEYVEDVAGALAEVHRVLRPGGRLLVLDTDWDSVVWHSSDRERMRRVLEVWEGHLADPRLPRRLRALMAGAGFTVTRREVIPILNAGYDRDTFSANVLATIAAFVSGRGDVSEADAAAWKADLVGLGEDYLFTVNRYVFVGVK
jgi:ubiquinone/menaquinone biosynthesis C-methylase UbiE